MTHNLTDCTFIIPFSYDHPDRIENICLVTDFLNKHFDTNILIGELNTTAIEWEAVHFDYGGKFHRTKALNHLTNLAETKYVINWDADVLCDPKQLVQMAERLRAGIDMVYPYDGNFASVSRSFLPQLQKELNVKCLQGHKHRNLGNYAALPVIGVKGSVGGAVGFNKERYMSIGGENENFVSWGPEDVERYWRAQLLGLTIERVDGILYHVDHYRGQNSSMATGESKENHKYWNWLQGLTRDQVIEHLNLRLNDRGYPGGWKLEDAIKEHAFSLELAYHIYKLIEDYDTVFDLGSGPGFYAQFLHKRDMVVVAIDDGDNSDVCLHPVVNMDILDLNTNPFDVVLCLEVGEHVPKEDERLLLDRVCQHAKEKIILSWAIPGQGGFGHVNCQSNEYIVAQMKARGWQIDWDESNYLRERCSGCSWFENTLMVFNLPSPK
jgi:hypothetical protein